MNAATATVVIACVGMALATMAFTVVVRARTVMRQSRTLLARNATEAARAEKIVDSGAKPPIPQTGPSPAEFA